MQRHRHGDVVESGGVRVPAQQAEATRRRLQAEGRLRTDLNVRKDGPEVVFPVEGEAPRFDFEPRATRPRRYQDLLPAAWRDEAPRAHDVLGDIAIIKVPPALWEQRQAIGEALLAFHGARAVFHDNGVVGEFRTRDLVLLAGEGGSGTTVHENGARLHIDPAKAYFSPRLADERARLTSMAEPGRRWLDLFAGVAPLGVQVAKAGADVVCVDLNPEACALARRNAEVNGVTLEVHCEDARVAGPARGPADHVVMNLPHDAKHFIAAGVAAVAPGGTLHHHEIMRDDALEGRQQALLDEIAALGRDARISQVRHVRAYSTTEGHYAIDLEVD